MDNQNKRTYTREEKVEYYKKQVLFYQRKQEFALRRIAELTSPDYQNWESSLQKELEQIKEQILKAP